MKKVSIIIPTLNEENYIGSLLSDLTSQTHEPHEVIVVDGFSTDNTASIVSSYPTVTLLQIRPQVARQRTHGGTQATGEVLVFLDADTRVHKKFTETVSRKMDTHGSGVAIPWYIPSTQHPVLLVGFGFFNLIFWLLHKVLPSGAGMCIIATKTAFEKHGGFKDAYKFDDIEFIRRLGHRTKSSHFLLPLRVSVRRFEKYGVYSTLAKYFILSFFFTFHLWKLSNYVDYEFGKFKK